MACWVATKLAIGRASDALRGLREKSLDHGQDVRSRLRVSTGSKAGAPCLPIKTSYLIRENDPCNNTASRQLNFKWIPLYLGSDWATEGKTRLAVVGRRAKNKCGAVSGLLVHLACGVKLSHTISPPSGAQDGERVCLNSPQRSGRHPSPVPDAGSQALSGPRENPSHRSASAATRRFHLEQVLWPILLGLPIAVQ